MYYSSPYIFLLGHRNLSPVNRQSVLLAPENEKDGCHKAPVLIKRVATVFGSHEEAITLGF